MAPTYLDINMKVEELEIPPSPIPVHDIDYEIPNPQIQNTDSEIPNPTIQDSEFVSCEILPDLPDNSYENPLETGNKVLETGNKVHETGNKVLDTGNKVIETENKVLETGNKINLTNKANDPLMQHGLIKNPKDNKPFMLGKNITITKSNLNDPKVKKMIFKKKVNGNKSVKKIIAANLAQNPDMKQNIKKESQKYEILPDLMQRQIHQQNSVQKINTKPIFLGDNITITKSVPYKTGNLKNLLEPVKKATKSPKREILPDFPENSLRNSFEAHDNEPLIHKPNHKTSLIGNNIIDLESEPDTNVNLNQFENNSLMPVRKTHPEEQHHKIESKNQIPSVHDKKRPSDAKKPHKCSICSFTCSSKQYLQNHIMKKHDVTAHVRKNTKTESPKHEILPDLPENSPRNSFEAHDNDPLIQKPNHENTGLIDNDNIVMKSEPEKKIYLYQFENNSLMPVKKTHPEEQPQGQLISKANILVLI